MTDRYVYTDAQSAVNRLLNNGISVDGAEKSITFSAHRLPGIKLWGAIDYLCRYHKYIWGKVR